MSDDLATRLAQLKDLHAQGLLPEAVYHSKVEQLLAQADLAPQTDDHTAVTVTGDANPTAVDHSVAVGRDLNGNVYIGRSPRDDADALRIYCRVTAYLHGRLPLRGRDVGASDATGVPRPLQLSHVYIDLNTTERRRGDDQPSDTPLDESRLLQARDEQAPPLSALAAACANRQLVLTGDPGSGKSTFVNYLAHSLALRRLQPPDPPLPDWPDDDRSVPIVVVLRDFAYDLPTPLPDHALPTHLWQFIRARLTQRNLERAADALHDKLEAGEALILLDGLDELPTHDLRRFVRDAIAVFARRYPGNRLLVTCRTLSYQRPADPEEADLRLAERDFPQFTLAPFDDDQIARFIEAWYAELVQTGSLTPEGGDQQVADLKEAIERTDLRRLARTPLLLTVMALVHTHRGALPDARALLYEQTVEMLLWRWEELRNAEGQRLVTLRQRLHAVGRKESDFLRILWRLAFDAHSVDAVRQGADISEWDLQQALAALNDGSRDWAAELIQLIKLRAGLLVEREPTVFSFPHRTYQEYLAGCHLSVQQEFAAAATRRIVADLPLWREAVLLAVGRLVHSGDIDRPLALVATLCPRRADGEPAVWTRAWFAGDVLLEIGRYQVAHSPFGRDLLAQVQDRLVALLEGAHLTPQERVLAGDTLAALGDPRPGVCTREPALIDVPAGRFLMGDDELIEHDLPAFQIGRYPVTNAQFRFFVEDGGYTERWRACWTDDGWAYRQSNGWTQPRYWDTPVLAHANQPVVGVSWYEALAYVNWLQTISGTPYRLPTEAQWERAARHTDGRAYTWGDAWQAGLLNGRDLNLERPSAVAAFPLSAAACGAHDLLGNVWEWCQTRWQDEQGTQYLLPYRPDDGRELLDGGWQAYRVLRGGSFLESDSVTRCGFRFGNSPYYGLGNRGFRVAVSPLISAL